MKKTILTVQTKNVNVNEKLLSDLQRLNQQSSNIVPAVKASGFAINHPFDSNIFRDAIKDGSKSLDKLDQVVARTIGWQY